MSGSSRLMLLFIAMIALFMAIGLILSTIFAMSWSSLLVVFLALAVVVNAVSYFYSDKIVLRAYGAKIATKEQQPRLYNIVNKVCLKGNLTMPKIAVIPVQTPNAFATGRNEKTAVVAATEGIMSLLSDDELEGVLAHEMAHVKDRDILVMSVAATIAGAISIAARMGLWSSLGGRRGNSNAILMLLLLITVPIAAALIRLAISRNREYKADREGAIMIQRPLALARALEKLEEGNRRRPLQRGSPASASLFIVNPFRGDGFVTIFMTHPSIASRVRRLELLADQTGYIG